MASLEPQYQSMKARLCQLLVEHSDSYSLDDILDFRLFREAVNSPRDMESIKDVPHFIQILEARNRVHMNDVSMLSMICVKLKLNLRNPNSNWIQEAVALVDGYKGRINGRSCLKCNQKYGQPHWVCQSKETNVSQPTESTSSAEVCDVEAAPQPTHTTRNAEEWWTRIAGSCDLRFLRKLPGLTERDINAIRGRYSNNSVESLRQCFFHWLSVGGDSVRAETVTRAFIDSGNMDPGVLLLG